jgi:hypothetical protein
MAHKAQREFCDSVRVKYPEMFKNKKVLDVGSLDNNGNNQQLLYNTCKIFCLGYLYGSQYKNQVVNSPYEFQ